MACCSRLRIHSPGRCQRLNCVGAWSDRRYWPKSWATTTSGRQSTTAPTTTSRPSSHCWPHWRPRPAASDSAPISSSCRSIIRFTQKLDEAGDFQIPGGYFGVEPLPPAEALDTAQGLHFFGAPPIIGTPEDAIREITRSQQEAGVTHLVMWMQIGGIDPRRAEHSMRLFATEVMPHFAVQEG